MSYINELKQSGLGEIGMKELTQARKLVCETWESTGLLDGIKSNIVKENISQLMENQLSTMIKEDTTSASSGSYETVVFPIIRRIFSKLLANDIVSVQTLSMPTGRLYYFNPVVSVRDANGHNHVMDGAYSNAATSTDKTKFSSTSLYEAYYSSDPFSEGNGLFDASKGAVTVITGTTNATGLTSGISQSAIVAVTGFNLAPERGTIYGPTGNVMDTEEFLSDFTLYTNTALVDGYNGSTSVPVGGKVLFSVKPQIYGQAIVDNTNTLLLVVDLSYPTTNGAYTGYTFSGQPSFSFAYKSYSNLEEDSEMAEVSFKLDFVTVDVTTRKSRAVWTPELSQDVNAFHNIDAEAELTALLSEEMAVEIDREILRDLRRGASWVTRWDYNGLRKSTNAVGITQKDWNQGLITKINQISAQIKKSTLRGGATWIVISPEVSAVFDDLQYFQVSDASAESYKYNMGIEKIGTLQGRYSVIVDPYAPSNVVLVGHKGSSLLEAGYIYSPYIPMMLTPIMYNYSNFSSVRGILTRFAKKMIFNKYYGKVNCDGIVSFNPSF